VRTEGKSSLKREPLKDAVAAWRTGVRAVSPEGAVRAWLRVHPSFDPSAANTLTVATGKAAAGMARALGPRGRGFVLVPMGTDPGALAPGWTVLHGEHPIPGRNSFESTRRILREVAKLSAGDRLLYLISGGTSALFEMPLDTLDQTAVTTAYRVLLGSGADIGDMNVVRRALSASKGGGLLRVAHPASVTTLAVSDVAADDPVTIGSGPTVLAADRRGQAFEILERYHLLDVMPPSVVAACRDRESSGADQAGGGVIPASFDVILSVASAEEAAKSHLTRAGYEVVDAPFARLSGDAAEAARRIATAMLAMRGRGRDRAYVVGGETTVRLPAAIGTGGRNQHLAALLACELEGKRGLACMVGGTDGRDGNSDAAGALVHGGTAAIARRRGVELDRAIQRFDSGTALRAAGAAVRIGASGTNVGDLLVATASAHAE